MPRLTSWNNVDVIIIGRIILQPQLRPSSVAPVKTVKLTIIYGNTFRKGPTPSEHKWKMMYDLDGDQEAINCVKVTYCALIRVWVMCI